MKTISIVQADLPAIIAHHERLGANPSRFDLVTNPPLLKFHRKTGMPNKLGKISKEQSVSALVNFNYERNVNSQRLREDKAADFEAASNWFKHITPALVTHKDGQVYIFLRVLKQLGAPVFRDANGNRIASAKVQGFLPLVATPAKQALANPIRPITVNLSSVRRIVTDGMEYVITDAPLVVRPELISSSSVAHARV